MDFSEYPDLINDEGSQIDKEKLSLILRSDYEDTGIIKFPTLYLDKQGVGRIWTIYIQNDKCFTLSGKYDGKTDYKIVPREVKGGTIKNQGRINEKNAREDTISKAFTKWKSKIKKGGYDVDPHLDVNDQYPIIPMTFEPIDYDKIDWKIKWIGQPKLDGHRCVASWRDGKVKLHSRGRDEIHFLDHIRDNLKLIYDGIIDKEMIFFDGVLFAEGKVRSEISGIVRRKVNQKTDNEDLKVFFYVYDIYMRHSDKPYIERLGIAQKLIKGYQSVKVLACREILSQDKLSQYFDYCIERGYEGCMMKSPHNIYTISKRVRDIVKVKKYYHMDCVILSCIEAGGTRKGCPIFKLSRGDEYPSFECVPAMKEDTLRDIWLNRESYYGTLCVVRYFSINENDIPEFANIVEFKI